MLLFGAVVAFMDSLWSATGVYVTDFLVGLGMGAAERLLGLFHVVMGLWLMYLPFATLLNLAGGFDLPA